MVEPATADTVASPSSLPSSEKPAPSIASASAAPAASEPPSEEPWVLIATYWIGGDPDPACTRTAECYGAPTKPPETVAPAPFANCAARKHLMPFEATHTAKLRKEKGVAGCCYLQRMCKLLHHLN